MGEGLTADGLARLHAAAQQHVDDQRLPGLVALVARGGQVHVEALGKLAVGGAPVARDSSSGSHRRPSRSLRPLRSRWSTRA
jgi:hypothetical protein